MVIVMHPVGARLVDAREPLDMATGQDFCTPIGYNDKISLILYSIKVVKYKIYSFWDLSLVL